MSDPIRNASRLFRIAAIYGLIVLLPLYFAEPLIARYAPPALTHPEFYYGFIGAAATMQLVALTIATDPARFLPLMPIAAIGKFGFAGAVAVLFVTGRLEARDLPLPVIDLLLGVAFLIAWHRLRRVASAK
jgi:hypothetical protein